MTPPVGGIDPHQDTFTVGIVDAHGVEITHETFANTAAGYLEAIDLLDAVGVGQVGVEGSAKWGAHVAIALAAAGFDEWVSTLPAEDASDLLDTSAGRPVRWVHGSGWTERGT